MTEGEKYNQKLKKEEVMLIKGYTPGLGNEWKFYACVQMAEGPACGGGPARASVLQTCRGLRGAGPRGKHHSADPPL